MRAKIWYVMEAHGLTSESYLVYCGTKALATEIFNKIREEYRRCYNEGKPDAETSDEYYQENKFSVWVSGDLTEGEDIFLKLSWTWADIDEFKEVPEPLASDLRSYILARKI